MMIKTCSRAVVVLGLSLAATGALAASVHDGHGSITWVEAPIGLKFPSANWAASRMVGHFGRPAPAGTAAQTVVVTPTTRWVNITQDDVVRFVVGDRAFEWTFATHTTQAFALEEIAPTGFLPEGVRPTVYVAPNPLFQGGG